MKNKGKYVFISVFLSFILHTSLFVFVFRPIKAKAPHKIILSDKNSKNKSIQLDLKRLDLSSKTKNLNIFSFNEDQVSYDSVYKQDKVLELIYKKILSLWNDSIPPEPGKIKVRIFLNKNGELDDINILSNTGSNRLESFIVSIITQASPFFEIKNIVKTNQIVVDCVFVVD